MNSNLHNKLKLTETEGGGGEKRRWEGEGMVFWVNDEVSERSGWEGERSTTEGGERERGGSNPSNVLMHSSS